MPVSVWPIPMALICLHARSPPPILHLISIERERDPTHNTFARGRTSARARALGDRCVLACVRWIRDRLYIFMLAHVPRRAVQSVECSIAPRITVLTAGPDRGSRDALVCLLDGGGRSYRVGGVRLACSGLNSRVRVINQKGQRAEKESRPKTKCRYGFHTAGVRVVWINRARMSTKHA